MIRAGLLPTSCMSAKRTCSAAPSNASRSRSIFAGLTMASTGSSASNPARMKGSVPARNPSWPEYRSASWRNAAPAASPAVCSVVFISRELFFRRNVPRNALFTRISCSKGIYADRAGGFTPPSGDLDEGRPPAAFARPPPARPPVSPRVRRLGERLRLRSGSDAPVHVQIEEQLAERIASGELHTGEQLPPERNLARDLDVSRMTVRQALSSLAARGLVERGVGRGTFVASRKVDHDLTRVAGFSEQLARQGLKPGAKVLEVTEAPAGWRISAALEIAPKAPVVRLQRLRLAAD